MATAEAAARDDGARSYGGSWALVRQMWDKKQIRGWTYVPLLGGFLFAVAPVVLQGNTKLLLATQAFIGVGTFATAQGVATTAIVKERSHA
ncbi:hypothetical protein ABPG75_007450 [Micractinium tetrahymenae]